MRRRARASIAIACVILCVFDGAAAEAREKLSLARALRLARERWPAHRAAVARRDAAEGRIGAARAANRPTLTALARGGISGAREAFPTSDGAVFVNSWYAASSELGGQLRWTLLDFGRTSNGVRAAEAAAASSTHDVEVTDAVVAQRVAEAYVSVAYQTELLATIAQTIANRERTLGITQNLVKAGIQPPVEEIRVKVRLDAARRDFAEAQSLSIAPRAELAVILGESTEAPLETVRPVLPPVELKATEAEHAAEARRPEVQRDALVLRSSEMTVASARARYLPAIGLGADAAYRFSQRDDPRVLLDTRNVQAFLTLSMPILDFSIGAQVDIARAEAAEAAAQLETTRRTIRGAGGQYAVEARLMNERFERARLVESGAKTLFEVAQERYTNGRGGVLEMLDAESTESDSRLERLRAELGLALATVRALAATGQIGKLERGP